MTSFDSLPLVLTRLCRYILHVSGKVNAAFAARRFFPGVTGRCLVTFVLLGLAGTLSAQTADDPGTPLANAAAARPTPEPTPPLQAPQAPARSTVYSIHESATSASRVRSMVDRLVVAVTAKENAAAGWRSLVDPRDVVGIKIAATGQSSGTMHRAVVEAIIDGLRAAGIPASNIVVWDRDAEDLQAAGYLTRDGRSTLPCAVLAIEPRLGYDSKEVYSAPILGKLIWGDLLFHGNPIAADETLHSERPAFGLNPLEDHPTPRRPSPGRATLVCSGKTSATSATTARSCRAG